ncbi:MAG: outer membrane protein assembly factor BamB family protein [Planctomycetota bacterium]|jgi:outer membrane protein assembly factor BamB
MAPRLPTLLFLVVGTLFLNSRPAAAQLPFREAVSINVDSQVVRTLETAREHIAQQQWSEAIPILQQIAESRTSSLIPIEPGHYGNSADYCHLLISLLPEDGLAAYREQIDPRFRQRFETARERLDETELAAIVRAAFNSSYGDDALLLLADLKFERGHYAAARHCLELLIPAGDEAEVSDDGVQPAAADPLAAAFLEYRDSDVPDESVLARLVLCSIFEGARQRAEFELSVFAERHPDAVGQLAGRDGHFVEILQSVLAESASWPPAGSQAGTTFGGSSARNPAPVEALRPVQVLWRRTIPPSPFDGPLVRPLLRQERPWSLHPVVIDGRVYVQNSQSIMAFNLETGHPAWSDDASDSPVLYPAAAPRLTRAYEPDTGIPAFTLTAAEGRLFARLGAPFLRKSANEMRTASEIVALNIAEREGQLDVRITSDQIDDQASSPQATAWSFEGTPVVREGRLYVSLRQGSPEDLSVVACFDAHTGKLIWKTQVAASLGNLPDHFNLLGTNLLTLEDGRLFLTTGTGAIAAVEAETGRLLWVVTYESADVEVLETLSDPRRAGLTPCLVTQGTVYAAPLDSAVLFALEATTGRLVWSRRLPEPVRHLVGARDGRLFVSGQFLAAFDLRTGQAAWPQRVAFSNRTRGMSFQATLTHREIIWPSGDELLYVDQSDGTVNDRIHLREAFGLPAGNVAIAGEKLILAHPDELAVLLAHPRQAGRQKAPQAAD